MVNACYISNKIKRVPARMTSLWNILCYMWYRNSLHVTPDLSKYLPDYFPHSGCVQRSYTQETCWTSEVVHN